MNRPDRRARGQRGFTLIELMIALVVSSLLVGMILAIFLRMSLAYRGQQQVAGVQQLLASARAMLELDAKHAGMGMPTGVKIASSTTTRYSPVAVTNSATAPDQIRFLYADATTQAAVTANSPPAVAATVDLTTGFAVGDLVVLASPDITTPNPTDPAAANVVTYSSCILKIATIPSTTSITFTSVAPFGSAANAHCPNLIKNKTMLFKMVAHAYRIDQSRLPDGVLQMSPTGDLFGLNDWQDLAYGFTDIQIATQFYDGDGIDTADPDTDPNRDWYSGNLQQTMTQPVLDAVTYAAPLQVSISLVARTDRDVEGVATSQTPDLTVAANTTNNMIGDRASVALPSGSDLALQGSRIYRYMTFRVDLRNTGVGR